MTATTDVFPQPVVSAAPLARTRPFFWSVRREIWENRAIYLAAPIAACVVILGAVLGHTVAHSHMVFQPHGPRPVQVPEILSYLFAAFAILLTSAIAGVFYCLGALNTERRDRSVLFWKSLPVSDLTTVLSKAVVPSLIMPAITLVTIYLTHLAMLAMDMGHLAAQGRSVSQFLDNLPLMQVWLDLAYAFLLAVFWWAPLWSWLLLVSAWSKRMTFLWAVGPPLAICVIERMAFGTDYAWKLLAKRLDGGLGDGFTTPPPHVFELPWPDPVAFVTKPGVWIGLVIAAAFLAGAVWMRRRREPI